MSDSNIAVIVENRNINIDEIFARHLDYLPDEWEYFVWNEPGLKTANQYNNLLTSFRFWNQFTSYNRVLIFQHDSGILRTGIEEFMQYDYIGAPIKNIPFPAMNGGLSLRNPRAMIEVLNKLPHAGHNEDIRFSYAMEKYGYNLPSIEIAKKFSVETIFNMGSFGYHAMNKYLSKPEVNKILKQYENTHNNSL